MVTFKSYYALYFRIFHSSQKAGDGIAQWKQLLIIGGFTLMIWLSSCQEEVHSSVFHFSALGSALELSSSLPECHITHAPSFPLLHSCLATAVLVPLARWEGDKWITRQTPSLVISHTIVEKHKESAQP